MNNANKAKKFYYLKIKDSFLTSDTVDYLISQDGGNGFVYEVLYESLCLKTLNTGGRLERIINEVIIPYDIEKLRRDLRWFSVAQLQRGLSLFAELGLVFKDCDGTLVIAGVNEMTGYDTGGSIDKARHDFKAKLIEKGCTEEEVKRYLTDNPKGIYNPIYKVYQEIRDYRLEIIDKSSETKDETPSQSSPSINQCLTNDKPLVARVDPLVGFLFDHGYLTKFDCEDQDDMNRYRDLYKGLMDNFGNKNVMISSKYFVACYCTKTYREGKFLGWSLRHGCDITSKYALFEKAMISNCNKFKDGSRECDPWIKISEAVDDDSSSEKWDEVMRTTSICLGGNASDN